MKKAEAGFTLIEVLATLVIFAVASLATASLMLSSMAMTSATAQHSRAIALAQQAIEDLRTLPYDNIASGSETASFDNTEYTTSRTVTADAPALGMKTIVVTVSWQNKGKPKSYVLETVFTQVDT